MQPVLYQMHVTVRMLTLFSSEWIRKENTLSQQFTLNDLNYCRESKASIFFFAFQSETHKTVELRKVPQLFFLSVVTLSSSISVF